jgi:hypothetical protein
MLRSAGAPAAFAGMMPALQNWIPAFAGMTCFRGNDVILRSAAGSLPDELESELNLP